MHSDPVSDHAGRLLMLTAMQASSWARLTVPPLSPAERETWFLSAYLVERVGCAEVPDERTAQLHLGVIAAYREMCIQWWAPEEPEDYLRELASRAEQYDAAGGAAFRPALRPDGEPRSLPLQCALAAVFGRLLGEPHPRHMVEVFTIWGQVSRVVLDGMA